MSHHALRQPLLLLALSLSFVSFAGKAQTIENDSEKAWLDTQGEYINCHGGGILFHEGRYYWYGEHRVEHMRFISQDGVACYSSDDMATWQYEGIVLAANTNDWDSDIALGCLMERPKVVYNATTNKFVMLFHLELRGQGYNAARVGFAVSDTPTGNFQYLRSMRPNAGQWPLGFTDEEKEAALALADKPENEIEAGGSSRKDALSRGLYLIRDLEGGQMSRDMTVYIDRDGTAYHLFSSEENYTLHLAELTPDYLDYTGHYIRIAPGGHNEAPAIFYNNGFYWLITSGCTGWEPNEARLFRAQSIWGPWEQLPNPCVGEGSHRTFESQSTFIFENPFRAGQFVLMADRWNPRRLSRSGHLWLPIEIDGDNNLTIPYQTSWNLK